MSFNINVHPLAPTDAVGLQLFDYYYAWLQSQHADQDYKVESTTVKYSQGPLPDHFNILFAHMPNNPLANLEQYDLIILDNADEDLGTGTTTMCDVFEKYPNSYLLANAVLDQNHPLYNRVIPTMCDVYKLRQYMLSPLYPQYYDFDLLEKIDKKRKSVIFINGSNRACRWHFNKILKECIPEIDIKSNITRDGVVLNLKESFFESNEDTEFRNWLNEYYSVVDDEVGGRVTNEFAEKVNDTYYSLSVMCGFENRYGLVPPGYFLIKEYFDYHCVIYPETGWTNGQLAITEKAIKCFYSRSFPMPVSGSYINQLYNKLGFRTAWNLLPTELQAFDSNDNHKERYEQLVEAIKWLHNNPTIFESKQAKEMLEHNLFRALTLHSSKKVEKIFDNVLKSIIK
jgi:hypothetical protein